MGTCHQHETGHEWEYDVEEKGRGGKEEGREGGGKQKGCPWTDGRSQKEGSCVERRR